MAITGEEQQRWLSFISGQLRILGGLAYGPDIRLWHYTGASGLLGILSTHQLRATANDCLNDSTEISYAEGLYRRAIRNLHNDGHETGDRLNFLKRMLDCFDKAEGGPDDPTETSYYITCFREKRDDLSQWRAYGESGLGSGYAIAFSPTNHIKNNLVKVNYDSQTHADGATRLAKATLDFFVEGLAARQGVDWISWYEEFVAAWDQIQYWLAPVVKHESFAVENE